MAAGLPAASFACCGEATVRPSASRFAASRSGFSTGNGTAGTDPAMVASAMTPGMSQAADTDDESDPTGQQQNQQDDDDEPSDAGWRVTPTTAVRPGRQRADEDQDQDDDEESLHGMPPLSCPDGATG